LGDQVASRPAEDVANKEDAHRQMAARRPKISMVARITMRASARQSRRFAKARATLTEELLKSAGAPVARPDPSLRLAGSRSRPSERRLAQDDKFLLQLGGAQKIIGAGGGELQVSDAARVHQHGIEIPKVDVGQVAAQDLLHLHVDASALFLIEFAAA